MNAPPTPESPQKPSAPDGIPTPAATLVIFRKARSTASAPELLFVQRAKEMRFAGGATVFPGGRIDEADRAFAAEIGTDSDNLAELAARIAAIRETLEETGLLVALADPVSMAQARAARALLLERGALAPVLAQFGWRLAPEVLTPFAHWCPPSPRAFDTRFFLADLGTGAVDIAVDATENTRAFWMTAAGALTAADGGEISIVFPTRRNLERLALFASFAEARAHAVALGVRTISPSLVTRDGEDWLTIPEGHGYPVLGESMRTVRRG